MKIIKLRLDALFLAGLFIIFGCSSWDGSLALSVDYDRSVEDGVVAGKYEFFSPDINTKNFPPKRSGVVFVQVEFFSFSRNITGREALLELKNRGYRALELRELLALGERFPEILNKFPVIALGSVWCRRPKYCEVPNAYALKKRDGSWSRRLDLYGINMNYGTNCRFPAVKEQM